MKTRVASLIGGIVGGLGVLCFLVAFGTDYWLLASDDCVAIDPHHGSTVTITTIGPSTSDAATTAAATTAAATTANATTVSATTVAATTIAATTLAATNAAATTAAAVVTVAATNAAAVVTAAATNAVAITAAATSNTGTDNSESLPQPQAQQSLEDVSVAPTVTLHHEGFFWRCEFQAEPSMHVILAVLFTNQPTSKVCIHGYLFPLPVAVGPVPHPFYDSTAVFRGFWTVFIILALVAGLVGGFLLVCAVPFTSHKLYRLGGIFLITAASIFLLLVVLFVLWKELVDMRGYILQDRGIDCPDVQPEAHYGWSFMVATAGIPLALLSGLLFFFTGRHLQRAK